MNSEASIEEDFKYCSIVGSMQSYGVRSLYRVIQRL